jgi:hypothetical protein
MDWLENCLSEYEALRKRHVATAEAMLPEYAARIGWLASAPDTLVMRAPDVRWSMVRATRSRPDRNLRSAIPSDLSWTEEQ